MLLLKPIRLLALALCLTLFLEAGLDSRHQAYREVYLLSLEAYDVAQTPLEKQKSAWVIAQLYLKGKGLTKNIKQAVKWHKRAANYGQVEAMEYLIRYYFATQNNLEKGVFWAHKAAVKGSDLGISSVGLFFEQANEMEKAAKWYEKGAALKGSYSMYYLGMMYKKGLWYHKDKKKALYWLQKAAKAGNVKAKKVLKD